VSRNGDQFGSDEFLRLFDFPLMRASVAQRPTSIVPQQYLFMLNSSFMIDRSKKLASLAQDAVSDPASRVDWLYRRVYGRAPTDLETAIGVEYLTVAESTVELDSGQGEKPNGSLLLHDFDGADYDDWVAVGTAFGNGPAKGTLAGQMEVTGFLGTGLVNSFLGGDGATGTLTSPEFKIDRKQIHMLVGGGKYPGATCIDLIVNGQVVRTATGPNDRGGGSERLSWSTWDVQPWVGQTAVFRIVDSRTEGWGHINVDHIYQSNDAHHLDHMPQPTGKPKLADRLQQYAQVLLSSNEFLFVR
jgi:hypothetical protein